MSKQQRKEEVKRHLGNLVCIAMMHDLNDDQHLTGEAVNDVVEYLLREGTLDQKSITDSAKFYVRNVLSK